MKSLIWKSLIGISLLGAGCQQAVTLPDSGDHFPTPIAPAWTHQARFAITDNRSDTLSFVTADRPMPALLGNTPVGDNPVELEGPHHLAASPDGRFIYFNLSNYVPGTGSGPHGSHGLGNVPGSLVKLDAATLQKVGEVLVDRSPGDVILSSDGKLAYVSHYDLLKLQQALTTGATEDMAYSTLAIVDTASMTRLSLTPLCVTSHGEGLSLDGKTLYVACAQIDELAVVDVSDPAHPQVTMRVPIGPSATHLGGAPSYGPYALAVSPTDGTVWISDNNSGDVRVFDPRTMKMDPARVIFVNGVAMFSAFTNDGKTLYVPHQGDDQVTAIDVASLATRNLPLPAAACLNVHMITISPDQSSAVLVCEGDHITRPGSAIAVSLATFSITGYVNVNLFPDGAAWLPPAP